MSLEKWKQVPFHTLFRRVGKRTGRGDKQLLSVYRDHGVIIKSDRDDNFNRPGESLDAYQLANPGDLVLNKMKTWQGSLGVSAYEGIVSPAYFVYEPQGEFDNRYMHHLLRSQDSIDYYGAHSKGIRVNQWDLQPEYLDKMKVLLPPLETQQRIADYLDRETAEIDAAVADLDRYVELLDKRRLLIVDEVLNSQGGAVSAGPEMPLKLIIQNRFVGDWGEEPGIAEVDAVCVRVADFNRLANRVNDQVPTSRSYTREKYEAKRLHHHDILIERSGGGDKTPVGSAMLYTGGDEALCANFIEVVRLNSDQLPEYWVHVLRREYMGRKTMRFVKQTTGIQNLDPQGFYDQKFRIPILSEQQRLTSIMRERTSEIESLIAESTKLRNLLLKRRSVLITEVVTGRKQV